MDPVTEDDLSTTPGTKALVRDIYAHSLTVLNNLQDILPLRGLGGLKIAYLSITGEAHPGPGQGPPDPFRAMAANYTRIDQFCWHPGMTAGDSLLDKLDGYDVVLTGICTDKEPGDAGSMEGLISSLSQKTHVIAVCFGEPGPAGEPEGLLSPEGILSSDGLILAYRHNELTEELAAQLIFGGIGGNGKLPLAIGDTYPAGSGITTSGGLRLQYA